MQTINDIIAQAIAEELTGNESRFSTSVEIDENTIIEVSGSIEIDGYCEDDYFCGTGAYVTTAAYVSIESLEVFAYDEDGEEVQGLISPDTCEIENLLAEALAA